MKLTCPVCQSKYDLKEVATTAALREMVELASRFGNVWHLVEEYIEAFRVSQWGSVGPKKRVRLLQEVARLWDKCEFDYNGKRYRSDRAQIRAALDTVCNMDKFGFQNHNYLKKVLVNGAKRVSADGLTAQEEQDRESARKNEAMLRAENAADQEKDDGDDASMSTAEFKSKIGRLADRIGGKR